MPMFADDIPLSLYIHLPWCMRKCPYCDFNSHEIKTALPEDAYVNLLLKEVEGHLPLIKHRPLSSIFFGGGTPSLFSPQAIARILHGVTQRLALSPKLEITLEANPGTIDQDRFAGFLQAGINRLSLGVQSLQDDKLKALGRIHDRAHALHAIALAKEVGYQQINIDLMYGLPQQTLEEALADLKAALSYQPAHLSWYQLTIEPNTQFYKQRPPLPAEDTIWEMQTAGQTLLKSAGLKHYEISAYAKPGRQCVHNLNYWQFGDYLGIGAGAHSKITDPLAGKVMRFAQIRQPQAYLDPSKRQTVPINIISGQELVFEFMLNALRLVEGVPMELFTQRTGLCTRAIAPVLAKAIERGLVVDKPGLLRPTTLGLTFLNELTAMFLPPSP